LAIKHFTKTIEENRLNLKSGCLTLIPICNPAAFKQNKRFVEKNLNRVFKKHTDPKLYEEKLANILTGYIDICDFMLDLHSQSSPGLPFVFQDYEDTKTNNFARTVGVETIIKGWPEMYADANGLNAGDTANYAHEKNKIGIVVECGQHEDARAPHVAYLAIVNSLIHLGMIDKPATQSHQNHKIIRGQIVFTVPEEGGHLVKEWQHLQNISKGQELAVSSTGKSIRAPYDSVILLPKYAAKASEEWFYLGTHEHR